MKGWIVGLALLTAVACCLSAITGSAGAAGAHLPSGGPPTEGDTTSASQVADGGTIILTIDVETFGTAVVDGTLVSCMSGDLTWSVGTTSVHTLAITATGDYPYSWASVSGVMYGGEKTSFTGMVTNSCGTGTGNSVDFTIAFIAAAAPASTTTDAEQSVGFAATLTGAYAPFTYTWQTSAVTFGSASGAGAVSGASYTFVRAGTFTVYLNVTDGNGVSGTATSVVTVNPQLTVSITSSQEPTDATSTVTFGASVSGGASPYSYVWTLLGATRSTAATFPWAFATSGSYTVDLNVTDGLGEVASASRTEIVNTYPSISAYENVSAADVMASIAYSAIGLGGSGGYSYTWTLNSVVISLASSFDYAYSSAGSYAVFATAVDSTGAESGAVSLPITIEPDPIARESAAVNPANSGSQTSFTANVTAGTGVAPFVWSWTVNGAVEGSGYGSPTTFSYTFESPGTYWVNATATDADGFRSIASIHETIQSGPLGASLHAPAVNLDPDTSETFTVTASAGVPPYTYSWDINGTSVGVTASSFTRMFTGSAVYNVTCIVQDSVGSRFVATINVTVVPMPTAEIVSGPTALDSGVTGTWRASVTNGVGPYNYSWSAPGSGASDGVAFSRALPVLGLVHVEVVVSDSFGNDATAIVNVTVSVDPTPTLYHSSPIVVSVPTNLTLSITGGTAPIVVVWTFSGGAQETGATVFQTFSTGGPTTVSARITDAGAFLQMWNYTLPVQLYVTASASPSIGIAPIEVEFTPSVLGGSELSFGWTFGGGGTSVAEFPTVTFEAGNWTTELKATASSGAVGYANITVISLPPPALVTWLPATNVTVLSSVRFTATPSWDAPGPWTATWTFATGATLVGLVVNDTFAVYSESNTVELAFTYSGGSWNDTFIVEMLPAHPTISVSGVYTNVPPGTLLDLNAGASSSPDSHIALWSWTYDGRAYSGAQLFLYVNQTGSFDLNLTVTDAWGATAHQTWPIIVATPGSSSSIVITIAQSSIAATITFAVQVVALNGVSTAEAEFEGTLLPLSIVNSTSTEANYTLSIDQGSYQAGTYSFEILVWDEDGASNTRTVLVGISSAYAAGSTNIFTELVGALGGTDGFLELIGVLVGVIGLAVAVYIPRRNKGKVTIDVDGVQINGSPGKPVTLTRPRGHP